MKYNVTFMAGLVTLHVVVLITLYCYMTMGGW